MSEPGFWDSGDAARDTIAESNQLKAWVDPWLDLERRGRELSELAELLEADADESIIA